MSDKPNPFNAADWELCDEHETTFLRGDYCKECRIEYLEKQVEEYDSLIQRGVRELKALVDYDSNDGDGIGWNNIVDDILSELERIKGEG